MLQRLELIGFKSFADKTRFDFAPGITAVVGPNGSGKSNVVDAVKWVLGERSAKALRGGEMTDVIFNGSSTRKSLGVAEVTLAFDNARRHLNADDDHVQVTRRVYRDGQGEYLINGRPCRLKDVQDLFLGSGAGHAAYSVIEQGRVDALLTTSTADRRGVFEEAAGISRFKAKKQEALRKLDRVEADLTRVRDVLGELDKQLRTLRIQAAKVQKHDEYAGRLRELRVGLGLTEYRDLDAALAREQAVLTGLRAETAGVTAEADAGEARVRAIEAALAAASSELRAHERRLAAATQAIHAHESTARAERGQAAGLESELTRLGRQRADLTARVRRIEAGLAGASREVVEAERAVGDEQRRAEAAVAALDAVTSRIADLAKRSQTDRERQFELVARSARLRGESDAHRSDAHRLRGDLGRKAQEGERTRQRHDALDAALADLARTGADLQQKLTDADRQRADHLAHRDELWRQCEQLQSDLEDAREGRSALRGRADVLDGLEQSLEGLGGGVRDVLKRLAAGTSALAPVAGLVADLLTAPRHAAPLIDLALGDAAQRFVVTDPARLPEVVAELADVTGRVGLAPLAPPPLPFDPAPGIRADLLASCDRPGLASLSAQLLGNVVVVETLADAYAHPHRAARFVTRAGELLEPDGTLTVGPAVGGGGILSRKSELRDLREQVRRLDEQIAATEAAQADYRRQADALDAPLRMLDAEIHALGGEAGTVQTRVRDQQLEQVRLADLLHLIRRETAQAEADVATAEAALAEAERLCRESEEAERLLAARLTRADVDLTAAQQERDARQADNVAAQVALSRGRQHLAGLRTRRDELDDELNRRRIDGVNLGSAERSARKRLTDSVLATLRATAAAATAYAEKDDAGRAVQVLSTDRDRLAADRDRVQSALKRLRDAWASHKDRAHAREMAVRDLQHRRDSVAARIREDYALELADLVPPPPAGTDDDPVPLVAADPDAVPAADEIEELKRKLAKLGSVNPEAVAELAEVEGREKDLRAQHDDLADARGKLAAIIAQIDNDSRKLFTDTLAAVRGHFQELFRKLFGGGAADVRLEDESNPLESGIEVTARPPGKELRSISLLSGGERTLTAVALLLAIFRSRPSPFCLLDEVDAALDEANTARLAAALHEFLDQSQFIVVTHKKRTMAAADVLYGVTMQESGVSKQVAVRFEDWPDEGEQPARAAA